MIRKWLNWTAMAAVSAVLALGAVVPASAGQRDNNGASTRQQRDFKQGAGDHKVRSPQIDQSRRRDNGTHRRNSGKMARSHRSNVEIRHDSKRNYRTGKHSSAAVRSNHGANRQHMQKRDRSKTGGK